MLDQLATIARDYFETLIPWLDLCTSETDNASPEIHELFSSLELEQVRVRGVTTPILDEL